MCGFIKAIVTSLKGVLASGGGLHMEDLDDDDDVSYLSEGDDEATLKVVEAQKPAEKSDKIAQALAKNKAEAEVPDSWDEERDTSESESEESMRGSDLVGSSAAKGAVAIQSEFGNGCGLMPVLRAFELLEAEFVDKFYKIGA
ncbi:dead deah box helicase [Fusarium coicis]|nr:dead deah box helicase [Fusarium coicis]